MENGYYGIICNEMMPRQASDIFYPFAWKPKYRYLVENKKRECKWDCFFEL